jgi:hypothetical protein
MRRKPTSPINISQNLMVRTPEFVVITRGGTVTGEDRVTPGKTAEGSGIRRAAEKAQLFDPRRERHTFEEARKEFVGEQASSSKVQPEVRECEMPPNLISLP